jgi:hypothetical protein
MVVFAAANFSSVDFHQMELAQLHAHAHGFREASFDAVVCNDVWEDLPRGERYHVLRQFHQVRAWRGAARRDAAWRDEA